MATVLPTNAGVVDVVNGSGASLVILIVMFAVFSAAAYFTGRLYGRAGLIAVVAGFIVVIGSLWTAGAIHFG